MERVCVTASTASELPRHKGHPLGASVKLQDFGCFFLTKGKSGCRVAISAKELQQAWLRVLSGRKPLKLIKREGHTTW